MKGTRNYQHNFYRLANGNSDKGPYGGVERLSNSLPVIKLKEYFYDHPPLVPSDRQPVTIYAYGDSLKPVYGMADRSIVDYGNGDSSVVIHTIIIGIYD